MSTEKKGDGEKRLREAFDLHDRKGNNYLPSSELGNALRCVGKRLTQDNVKTLVKKADSDCDGKISFDDFKRYVDQASDMEKKDKDIEYAFQVFSRNSDQKGAVELKEFKHALMTLGDKLTKKQVDAFLADAGFGEKSGGTISLDQFMKVIRTNS